MKKIERAIISVNDKSGIVDFAYHLDRLGVEIISTGGTATVLREAGIRLREVGDITGFPELFDGRVKTLHPLVHGGILCRRDNANDRQQQQDFRISTLDLVCVNLYPFESVSRRCNDWDEIIENIDIGGPALLRSAAKNMQDVTVVTDPADYALVLAELVEHNGATTKKLRWRLASKAFRRVAEYDVAIANYLTAKIDEREGSEFLPLLVSASEIRPLRYGENPHQKAALCVDKTSVSVQGIVASEILHGREMSYNNYVDGDAALRVISQIDLTPSVVIIKHNNPCGYATGSSLVAALDAAWNGDSVSAFGSIIAFNRPVDMAVADYLQGRFVEVIIAPGFDDDALEFLKKKSQSLRILRVGGVQKKGSESVVRQISGGWLVQTPDNPVISGWQVPTKKQFPSRKLALAEFGVMACKYAKSNAVVIVIEYIPGYFRVLASGAGQPNRLDAIKRLAIPKALENIELIYQQSRHEEVSLASFTQQVMEEAVLVSDAFFPFADNVEAAALGGLKYVVQPGGSKRDADVLAAADNHGIAMAYSGLRHFYH